MHFAILVEDASGKVMLETLVPKILGPDTPHSFEIKAYKGIGHIPKNLAYKSDPAKRLLLAELPRVIAGYGRWFSELPADCPGAVIVVCDLDDRNRKKFTEELRALLKPMHPAPNTTFCLAIEEGEAWLLGDLTAVFTAYPKAKRQVFADYENDAICGTWELLADAVYPGGNKKLNPQGYRVIGAEKARWAREISPHINVERNQSPSFGEFVMALKTTAE
ncbi:MAG: hypothetical protein NTU80_10575 [Verrucomicrobia bacterium]|nr:hypothetical protein [Verrucomicrobiota bacterium]